MSDVSNAIEPFVLSVAQSELDDLQRRLGQTRWPERQTVNGWEQGAPLQDVQALCAYWRDRYDWRRCEAMLNGFGQYRTAIDGLGIHFLHIRSPEPDALPMVMTHGWPGSVIEFHQVIGPLTDPAAHGGDPRSAFHLVLPSLPGFGFSDKPDAAGWGVDRIARAWATLMSRLGYQKYVAQGGDWGAFVTAAIGAARPAGCVGVHLNTVNAPPREGAAADPNPEEQDAFALMRRYGQEEFGYAKQMGTRPQTIGYALSDTPAGQAAWIYEKLRGWSDSPDGPEALFGMDAMLDNIMLYWFPNAGASSARLYWESLGDASMSKPIDLPIGVTIFPKDINKSPRRWAEPFFKNIMHWNEVARGGHFGAFEQPGTFVQELQDCFRTLR
jgi:pimeloyl-ACP methyl ester carboxylesterase